MSVPSTHDAVPDLFRLERALVLVGRDSRADLRLPHPAISRRHAELRVDGDRIHVRDLGSRSGVRINGRIVQTSEVCQDDVLSFGPLSYELKALQLRRLLNMQGTQIEIRGLNCRRGDRVVLSGMNLTIPPNNFVGILGPSGAGKTTLLKAMTGFLPLDAGDIFFDGVDLNEHREICRCLLGFVPQEDVLHYSLSARENLDFALRLRVTGDLRTEERAAWVEQTLKRLGLQDFADRPVHTLSGGQRKRVNVGVELLTRPRLLFLDEPTAGLDPAAESRLMEFLRDQAHRGMTIVCTTHVLESLAMFDAVMVVAGGQLLGSGKPQNLLHHFQCNTYAQLYEKLENPPPQKSRGNLPPPASQPVAPVAVQHRRVPLFNQVTTLLIRNVQLIRRDRALMALLVGQPLFLGMLINLSQWNFSENKTFDLITIFAIVASIWLGLNNTAREIIRDRAIYTRERRATLNPESYLLAKISLYAGIGFLQVLLLVLLIRYGTLLRFEPDEGNNIAAALGAFPLFKFIVVLWLTYLSSMFLGILISTLASSEEVAVAALPIVILPQLLLSGMATNTTYENTGYFESIPIMLKESEKDHRTVAGWACELVSMATYSRPAVVLLKFKAPADPNKPPPPKPIDVSKLVIDWSHLLFLLLVTATVFVMVFLKRERAWIESG